MQTTEANVYLDGFEWDERGRFRPVMEGSEAQSTITVWLPHRNGLYSVIADELFGRGVDVRVISEVPGARPAGKGFGPVRIAQLADYYADKILEDRFQKLLGDVEFDDASILAALRKSLAELIGRLDLKEESRPGQAAAIEPAAATQSSDQGRPCPPSDAQSSDPPCEPEIHEPAIPGLVRRKARGLLLRWLLPRPPSGQATGSRSVALE